VVNEYVLKMAHNHSYIRVFVEAVFVCDDMHRKLSLSLDLVWIMVGTIFDHDMLGRSSS